MQKRAAVLSINSGCHRAKVLDRRDALMLEYLPMVERIARGVARKLPPSFELEDLIGAGTVALADAALRYRPAKHGGTPFGAWARQRVHGAIVDSVRGRHYTENTRPGLENLIPFPGAVRSESEAMEEAAAPPTVEEEIDARRQAVRIAEAISWLPNQERAVLQAYYGVEEPTLQEVAQRLGVKRWRVQELHSSAIASLRARLKAAA